MTKQELHDQLALGPCTISEDVFIEIYGKDDKRKIQGIEQGRADILARVHGLTVTKQNTDYVFTR